MPNVDNIPAMLDEASRRISDAEFLEESLGNAVSSDLPYLLRLLALEILLNCCYESLFDVKSNHGHRYDELFQGLPRHCRDAVIVLAQKMTGESPLKDECGLMLRTWGSNLMKLKPPYAAHEKHASEGFRPAGICGPANCSPAAEAASGGYPQELDGFIYGLISVLDGLLSAKSAEHGRS